MMNAKDKQQYINELLIAYGNLLTKKQLAILTDKYQYDLSLNEIAANRNISRAAAQYSIKQSTNKLIQFENRLNLIKKKKEILQTLKGNKLEKKIIQIISK